jgi:hypothetical protein
METMQMLVTPGKEDLQEGMEVCQGGLAGHQHPTPDERADITQDDTELVDAERCGRGCHALRVAQRITPLKGAGVPEYSYHMGRTAVWVSHEPTSGLNPQAIRITTVSVVACDALLSIQSVTSLTT